MILPAIPRRPIPPARRLTQLTILLPLLAGVALAGCGVNAALRLTDEELLGLGQTLLERKSYEQSREVLEQLHKTFPGSPLAPTAQITIGESYYRQKRYSDAATEYSNFLRYYPAHAQAAEAQYFLALSRFKTTYGPERDQTQTREARDVFQQLLDRYPDSGYEKEAKEKLTELDTRLAEHELAVARFYLSDRECEAAEKRLHGVLDDYPGISVEPQAMYELGRSYLCLKRQEEAVATFRELVTAHPRTASAGRARVMLAKLDSKAKAES
ncbi:MAG: outer membrane protein assembly factor BamD [Candidatus Schekmanbacteria bacterium]|nr:outer membrane protein assembly factor BamD [Candidatus Schekmanbacteria bacterium]